MKSEYSALLSGYAKLPSNVTSESVFNTFAAVVVFDVRSGVILEAEVSMVTALAKNFVADMLVGYDLNRGPDELIARIDEHYFGSVKKALETALKMLFVRYQEYRAAHDR